MNPLSFPANMPEGSDARFGFIMDRLREIEKASNENVYDAARAGAWAIINGLVNVTVYPYRAKGDGSTDDFAEIQRAINSGAKFVYCPTGRYLIKGSYTGSNSSAAALVDGFSIPAGVQILGDGDGKTFFVQDTTAYYIVNVNPGLAGTTDPNDNTTNLVFRGICFINEEGTFEEQRHLTRFCAVSDILFDACCFTGFKGDAIYFAGATNTGIERHNQRVFIKRCKFDGVNRLNRNPITIVDCDVWAVVNCKFREFTKTGMPGGIDCEPNADSFAIIRNGLIQHCDFRGSDGAAVIFNLRQNSMLTVPHRNISAVDNYIEDCLFAFSTSTTDTTVSESTEPYQIKFARNFASNCAPFVISGIRGVELESNFFADAPNRGYLGYGTQNIYDVTLSKNTFIRCGGASTDAVWVYGAAKLSFRQNNWIDCGKYPSSPAAGRALSFVSGYSGSYITIDGDAFSSPTGRTTYAIGASGYTFNHGTCYENNVLYLFSTNTDFNVVNSRRFTAAPTSGTWAVGNIVWNKTPAVNNILCWICTVAGSPGTWQAVYTNDPRKADLTGAAFTGTVTGVTESANDNSTKFATTEYVDRAGLWKMVAKTADQAASSTTLADDTELQFVMEANTEYRIEGIYLLSIGTGGVSFGATGPASPTEVWLLCDRVTFASGTPFDGHITYGYASMISFVGGTVIAWAKFSGVIRNGATAGTFKMQIANSAAGTNTTYKQGSYLQYAKVA